MTTPSRPQYDRRTLADAILRRLDDASVAQARADFAAHSSPAWLKVDDLLPEAMAREVHAAFPQTSEMRERKTLREHKFVAAQMDRYSAQAEEALFAFQDPKVVARVAEMTGLPGLEPDPKLYAGGISVMGKDNFLNPHLDNSHDDERARYRVLNLLYYVSPGWGLGDGGHLELWPGGVEHDPLLIPSLFNRLVIMATGPGSWHSVTRVRSDERRCCVSNYYFSRSPVGDVPYSRVTTFRGRPEQRLRDLVLRADGVLRQAIRKIKPKGLVQTKHLYRRPDDPPR